METSSSHTARIEIPLPKGIDVYTPMMGAKPGRLTLVGLSDHSTEDAKQKIFDFITRLAVAAGGEVL